MLVPYISDPVARISQYIRRSSNCYPSGGSHRTGSRAATTGLAGPTVLIVTPGRFGTHPSRVCMRPKPHRNTNFPRAAVGSRTRPAYWSVPAGFNCTIPNRPSSGPYATQNVIPRSIGPGTTNRKVTPAVRGAARAPPSTPLERAFIGSTLTAMIAATTIATPSRRTATVLSESPPTHLHPRPAHEPSHQENY
jgi:hypothetical protein